MTALRKPNEAFTFEDYLAWEETQEVRHEYVNGVAYPMEGGPLGMAGGTQAHHDVVTNAMLAVSRVFGEHCRVYSQGFKVRVTRINDERGYYPDVFVTCRPGASTALFNTEPCLAVEVLSDSTRRIDLGEKLAAYSAVPSLEIYLVIDPQRAVVRVFRRATGWAAEDYEGLAAIIEVGCGVDQPAGSIRVGELYRNVFP